eukprot:1666385-Karenia_brevis.AAC.1
MRLKGTRSWPSEYRDWCEACVRARGKERDCSRDEKTERSLPEYVWDYCFPGGEIGYKWTVLLGGERKFKAIMATA